MKNILLIALREYAENAKTKGFWIGILLFPVMLFAGIRVPALLEKKAVPTRYFVVVDRSGQFTPLIDARIGAANAGTTGARKSPGAPSPESASVEEVEAAEGGAAASAPKPLPLTPPATVAQAVQEEVVRKKFDRVPVPDDVDTTSLASLRAGMRPYLTGDKRIEVGGKKTGVFALVVIPKNVVSQRRGVEYWCSNLADTGLKDVVLRVLNDEVRRRELVANGADPGLVSQIQGITVATTDKNPTKEAGDETVSEIDKIRQWAPSGFVYLLWTAIFTVAQMLLSNTTEEKSNRIIEVLLSSVTPTELMAGKLVGIAAVGITLVGAWIASLFPVLSLLGDTGRLAKHLIDVVYTPQMLVPFVGYFLLGFLLYAGVFLAIGSLCSTIKEAQNLMGPVMLVMFVPLLTMFFIPRDPHGTLAVVLSWIPLYTPFAMMNRVGASPPTSEILGTVALLLVAIPVTIWLSGRIFRIGILRTGQPPKLVELVRWVAGKAPI